MSVAWQLVEQACTSCDGVGSTLDVDHDEYGVLRTRVPCEGCEASGVLVSCRDCGEPTAAPVAHRQRGLCDACAADGEQRDADAERAELRRWAQ